MAPPFLTDQTRRQRAALKKIGAPGFQLIGRPVAALPGDPGTPYHTEKSVVVVVGAVHEPPLPSSALKKIGGTGFQPVQR